MSSCRFPWTVAAHDRRPRLNPRLWIIRNSLNQSNIYHIVIMYIWLTCTCTTIPYTVLSLLSYHCSLYFSLPSPRLSLPPLFPPFSPFLLNPTGAVRSPPTMGHGSVRGFCLLKGSFSSPLSPKCLLMGELFQLLDVNINNKVWSRPTLLVKCLETTLL